VVYVALTRVPDQSVHVVLWVASTVFKHLFHVDVEPLVDVEAAMVLDIDQKPTQLEGPRDLVILDEVTMLHPLPPLEVHLEVLFGKNVNGGKVATTMMGSGGHSVVNVFSTRLKLCEVYAQRQATSGRCYQKKLIRVEWLCWSWKRRLAQLQCFQPISASLVLILMVLDPQGQSVQVSWWQLLLTVPMMSLMPYGVCLRHGGLLLRQLLALSHWSL